MKSLSETWFAEGYIDFELKKYTLLAYLQEINRYFAACELYPSLADLVFHYNNLVAFRENKQQLSEQFPKRLTGIQAENIRLLYESIVEDSEMMQELEDIIGYASSNMKKSIDNGTGIYESIADALAIEPVGLVPLDSSEGYFLLCEGSCKNTWAYYYRLSIYEQDDYRWRSLRTSFIDVWQRNLANSYQSIKQQLIRNCTELPNPAVYAVETSISAPIEETLLPVAKRSLVKYISTRT